jgi:hypothetical protein
MLAWIVNLLTVIFGLVKTKPIEETLRKKYSGKIFVSGKDEISLPLKLRKPQEVNVFFIHSPIPCDHHKHDHLEWKLRKGVFETFLVIKWHVHGFREIEYVYY